MPVVVRSFSRSRSGARVSKGHGLLIGGTSDVRNALACEGRPMRDLCALRQDGPGSESRAGSARIEAAEGQRLRGRRIAVTGA